MVDVIYTDRYITREEIQKNPQWLYLYGDNDLRQGMGGMAQEFRGEPNTRGIRTKRAPSMASTAFYTDDNYKDSFKGPEDFWKALREVVEGKYNGIVIPDGIGEERAQLKQRAPKTYLVLKTLLTGAKSYLDLMIEKEEGAI